MPSIQSRFIRRFLIPRLRDALDFSQNTVEQLRRPSIALPVPSGTRIEEGSLGLLKAEWVKAANVPLGDDRTILYFHGGGFVTGTCRSYRGLAARISKAAGVRVLVVEYRLAPENPFPAANEDCLSAYRWLTESHVNFKRIILGGDSAGGGLALMTLLALRDAGEPLPSGVFMLSPFAEYIRLNGESYTTKSSSDPICDQEGNRISARYYMGANPTPPSILRPLDREMSGLPPMYIQVGEDEILFSDSQRLFERAEAAGVETDIEVWDGMWHVFQIMAPFLPEANRAINRIGEFVRKRLT